MPSCFAFFLWHHCPSTHNWNVSATFFCFFGLNLSSSFFMYLVLRPFTALPMPALFCHFILLLYLWLPYILFPGCPLPSFSHSALCMFSYCFPDQPPCSCATSASAFLHFPFFEAFLPWALRGWFPVYKMLSVLDKKLFIRVLLLLLLLYCNVPNILSTLLVAHNM